MTVTARTAATGKGLVLLAAAAFAVSACGPSDSSSGTSAASTPAATSAATSSTTTSASATTDMAKLVIQPSDIPIEGFTQKASTPVSQSGATGIAVSFASADGARQIGDTIVTLPDPSATKTALDAAVNAAKGQIPGVKSEAVQIGEGGALLTGTLSGQSVSVLAFQQGKAFVVIEFTSAANDPVPADVVNAVGEKQADLIKSGLPG